MIILFFAVIGGAVFDRMRGDQRGFGKVPELFAYGLCVWVAMGGRLGAWPALAFCALWALGASFGWGGVIGPILGRRPGSGEGEWWQVGLLRRNLWVAAVARGALWGAPVLLLMPAEPRVAFAFVSVTLAFPLALLIGRAMPDRRYHLGPLLIARTRWGAHELVRGGLCGIFCQTLSSVLG